MKTWPGPGIESSIFNTFVTAVRRRYHGLRRHGTSRCAMGHLGLEDGEARSRMDPELAVYE